MVQTIVAKSEAATAQEEVVGTVRAKRHATLEAKVSGRIISLPIKLGQRVKRGQLIARLDVKEISAKLQQARAVLKQTETDLKRYSTLVKQSAVTRREYDAVVSRHQIALAARKGAKSMLAYATVRAPFTGVITHKLAEEGNLATPGRPLVKIEDPSALRLEVGVPSGLHGYLKVGLTIPVKIAGMKERLDTTIAEISPSADPNSRTFLAKLELPASAKLRAGQFGRAYIPTGRKDILRIPQKAIRNWGQMEIVFVVAKAHAQLRLIKTGKAFGEMVEVVSGLDSGDELVATHVAGLIDGQPVGVGK
jgi:RND family efflux transporter MFP subunit